MSQNELADYRLPPGRRFFSQIVWGLEDAFKRAKAADQTEDATRARMRIFILLAVFATGFVLLAVGATRSAIFSGAGKTSGYLPPLGVARADLTDRDGRLLAVDLIHYGVYVDPREIWDTAETQRVLGAALPALQPARLDKALRSDRREYLLGGLTPDEKARIQDMGLPGVSFEEEQRRVYPLGTSASHVIGFTDKGGAGLAGMELAFDSDIRRQAGQGPYPTSLDLRVQAALDDELQKAAIKFGVNDAVGIVTNIHTGEVLAMSSWPSYDPNAPGASPPYNMVNRVAASVYEPGSVFKVFSMAMALDSGSATLNSTYNVESLQIGKRTIHDFHAVHGAITLPEVFIHSSNIGTAKMAIQAGAPTLTKYFKAFGLFAPAKIELNEAARPLLPRTWSEGTVASTSFGQSISVSPLNLAQGMGGILNGGELVPLTLRKVDPANRPKGVRIVSEDTSRKMLDLMRLNVTAKEGSGGKADAPGLSVGGKTGTAQLVIGGKYSKDKVLASFAAVFPTDGPIDADRYFVLIMLKDPKRLPETYGFATAGWNAAPAAGRVIDRIAPFVGVRRAAPALATATSIAATAMPSGDEGSAAIDETAQ
jgi:cell division protein FtsI (penicillin-binding protein 3)